MTGPIEKLEEIISKTESLSKIQFGQGLVFRASLVAIAVCGAIATIGWHIKNDFLLFLIICFLFYGFYWFFKEIKSYAEKNPDLALMEGATLYAWKRDQLAAKGLAPPPNDPITENPATNLSLTHVESESKDT